MRRLFVLAATAGLGMNAVLGSSAHPALADTGSTGAGTPSPSAIVATAQQYLGYPYAYIGDDPSTGFSCIGFVHFVFAQNGVYVPEDLSKAYASAPQIDQARLQPGDLVFFQNTAWNGISHVDIYAGNGKMIGADSFQTGVEWDTLSDAYWQQHYLGATRPLANGATAGAPATAVAAAPPPTPVATATPPETPLAPATVPASPESPLTPAATAAPSDALPVASTSAPAASNGPTGALVAGTIVTAVRPTPVYNGPGETYAGIDIVTPAMPLTVVQTQGAWVNVSYANGALYGWVLGSGLGAHGAATATGPAGSSPSGASAVSGSMNPSDAATIGGSTGNPARRTARRWNGADGYTGPPDDPAYPATAPSSPGKAIITADVLFVRASPNRHAHILRRVHSGDPVTIFATTGGWDYVQLRDGSRGWVSAGWVRARG